MNTPKLTLFTSLVLVTALTAGQEPAIPVGKLIVDHDLVLSGSIPKLEWQITHPKSLEDILEIDSTTDEIETKTELIVKVSIIGVGITDGRNEYAASSSIKFGNSPWQSIFSGYGSQVDPSVIHIEEKVPKGTKIQFAAYFDSWNYNSDDTIKILKDGDTPPSYASGYADQSSAEEYIQPYMKDGKITLGPMDILYTAELTHKSTGHSGFDMQDTIVLVRFEEVATEFGSAKGEVEENLNGGESVNDHQEVAQNSGNNGQQGNNGWGNGDQNAPSNSLENNNAENAQGNTGSTTHNGGCNKNNKKSYGKRSSDRSKGCGYSGGGHNCNN